MPSPSAVDFNPGDLLGCISGELGLRKFLESQGHELVVTADKDGDGCELEKHLPTANYVISQPRVHPRPCHRRGAGWRVERGSHV